MRFLFSKSTPLLSFSKKLKKQPKGFSKFSGMSGEGKNVPFFDKNKFLFFGGGGCKLKRI
jgi:hypothetical protein